MENFYTKQETDAILDAVKNQLDEAIEEIVTMSSEDGQTPSNNKTLHIQIINEEDL